MRSIRATTLNSTSESQPRSSKVSSRARTPWSGISSSPPHSCNSWARSVLVNLVIPGPLLSLPSQRRGRVLSLPGASQGCLEGGLGELAVNGFRIGVTAAVELVLVSADAPVEETRRSPCPGRRGDIYDAVLGTGSDGRAARRPPPARP